MKNSLNILMLGLVDPQKNDASKVHFYELANSFVKNGDRVTLLVPSNDIPLSLITNKLVVQMPIKYTENFLVIFVLCIFQIVYYCLLMKESYDFVYIRLRLFPCVFIKIINSIFSLKTQIYAEQAGWLEKEIEIQKDGFLRQKIGLFIQLTDAFCADKVIVMTQGIKEHLVNHCISHKKISVIENGTNIEHFYPLNINERVELKKELLDTNKIILGFMGNISKWQGIEDLFYAIKELRKTTQDFMLIVIGGGLHLNELKVISEREKLNDIVIFKENVSYSEMNKWINIIDIAFAPKIKELDGITSPLKLRDYAAAGKPVISSNIRGIKEYKRFGWLFTYDLTRKDLLDKISLLIRNQEVLRNAEVKARKFAEDNFSWDLIAKKIEHIHLNNFN